MLDLAGVWSLSDESGEYHASMTMPGDGIDALFKAGAIPDPYFGRNEYGLRWICQRDWVATRSFTVERVDQVLVVSMLDTVAEVRINGAPVLASGNMFRSYRADVSGALRLGQNEVTITFRSPAVEAVRRQAELVTEKDAAGLGFKVRLNGRDIFCTGANWIPQDALAGRINPAATLTFTPATPGATPHFTLRDLHSATYAA